MGTGRGLMAIPGGTEGIHGDEGVTGIGGGGCHGPFWKPKNVHEDSTHRAGPKVIQAHFYLGLLKGEVPCKISKYKIV